MTGSPASGPLAQRPDLVNQCINLRLLTHDHLVKLIKLVFRKGGLDLQVGQALLMVLVGCHGAIGPHAGARAA